jgi:hypothetical protein
MGRAAQHLDAASNEHRPARHSVRTHFLTSYAKSDSYEIKMCQFAKRSRIMARARHPLFAAAMMALCSSLPSQPSSAEYYDYDGRNLSYHAGDPPTHGLFIDYWAVYYFRQGVPTANPTFRWGMDISKSAAGVKKSVLQAQKFEKTYEKWCGCSWGPNTHFNPLYPVAVYSGQKIRQSSEFLKDLERMSNNRVVDSYGRKLHEIYDNISEILDRVNQAADLAGQRRIVPEWKDPLADFFRAMHKVLDQYAHLQAEVGDIGNQAIRNLDSALDSLESDVRQESQSADTVIATLNTTSNDTTDYEALAICEIRCAENCCTEALAVYGSQRTQWCEDNKPQYRACKRECRL